MKKLITIIGVLLLLSLVCGCSPYGSIYSVAADEREPETIVSDAKITAMIQKKFVEDPDIKVLDISVYCYKGNVYLVGEYDQAQQKERAVKIAETTEGVKSVKTHLLPKRKDAICGAVENLAIRTKLDAKLVADMEVWSTNIDVKVVQCNVVLLGIVESKEEITRAVAHARSVEGVRDVTSYLTSTE